jgi:hypothetical protein
MSRHHVTPARHAQGLSAYRAGRSIRELITTFEEIEQMHEQATTNEEHEEIDNAGPSLIAGFADGLVEDIRTLRTLVQARRGQTA